MEASRLRCCCSCDLGRFQVIQRVGQLRFQGFDLQGQQVLFLVDIADVNGRPAEPIQVIVARGRRVFRLGLGLLSLRHRRLQLLGGSGLVRLLTFQSPGQQFFQTLRLRIARLFQVGEALLAGAELLFQFRHPFRQCLGLLVQQVAFFLQVVARLLQIVAFLLPLLELGDQAGKVRLQFRFGRRELDFLGTFVFKQLSELRFDRGFGGVQLGQLVRPLSQILLLGRQIRIELLAEFFQRLPLALGCFQGFPGVRQLRVDGGQLGRDAANVFLDASILVGQGDFFTLQGSVQLGTLDQAGLQENRHDHDHDHGKQGHVIAGDPARQTRFAGMGGRFFELHAAVR